MDSLSIIVFYGALIFGFGFGLMHSTGSAGPAGLSSCKLLVVATLLSQLDGCWVGDSGRSG
jgi:hypothetical protein